MTAIQGAQIGATRFVGDSPAQGIVAALKTDGSIANLLLADPASGNTIHKVMGSGGSHVFHDAAGVALGWLGASWLAVPGEVYAKNNLNVREWANLLNRPTTLAGYGITDAAGAAHHHDAAYLKLSGGTLSGSLTINGNLAANTLRWSSGDYVGANAGVSANFLTSVGAALGTYQGFAVVSDSYSVPSPGMGNAYVKGNVDAGSLSLRGRVQVNRSGIGNTTGHGISWFSSAYRTWTDYMTPVGMLAPNGVAALGYGEVTSWAVRHNVENQAGYGWVWEGASNADTTNAPTPVMSLGSATGRLAVRGSLSTGGDLLFDSATPTIRADAAGASLRWQVGGSERLRLSTTQLSGAVAANFHNGSPHGGGGSYMAAGSLTLGGVTGNYGGGTSWNASTAALLLECAANTEIAVHHSGARVASLAFYQGARNVFVLGRDMGWGTTRVEQQGTDMLAHTLHGGGRIVLGNQDWTHLVESKLGIAYDAGQRGVVVTGSTVVRIRIRMPVDPEAQYTVRAKLRRISGGGSLYIGAASMDNAFTDIATDAASSYNYFGASGAALGGTATFEGSIGGYNPAGGGGATSFDPEAKYWDLVIICNYGGAADARTVVEWVEVYKNPQTTLRIHGGAAGALRVGQHADHGNYLGFWREGYEYALLTGDGNTYLNANAGSTVHVRTGNASVAEFNATRQLLAGDRYLLIGPNSSYGQSLRIGGNGNVDANASVVVTNGNLHLDASDSAHGIYANWWRGGELVVGNGAGAQRMKVSGEGIHLNDGWYRSHGQTGWYNETYQGGMYCTDTSYVRTYNARGLMAGGAGLVYEGGVSGDNTFGIYFDASRTSDYAIFREGGGWGAPYPDLRVAFHTGIKVGASSAYGGTRFYNNSDMATEIMSVGNGDDHVRMAGNCYAAAFYTASSAALKEDVRPLDTSALELLRGVEVVRFRYRGDAARSEKVGFIAERTDALLSGAERKGMDHANAIGLLLGAVQEMAARNDALAARNEELGERLARLEGGR